MDRCGGEKLIQLPPEAPHGELCSLLWHQVSNQPSIVVLGIWYVGPFVISMTEVEQLLTACAVDRGTRNPSQFQGDWGCFLIGDRRHFL